MSASSTESLRLNDLSILRLLAVAARRDPDAIAIAAPGRAPLSHGRLELSVDSSRRALHELGVGPDDRLALVLPQGPEMAVATIAAMSTAACAPLNPAYRETELDAYLASVRATAVIVEANAESPARVVARRRGIPIIELSADAGDAAGVFTLIGSRRGAASSPRVPGARDTALLQLTSGTTARPKLVPLTHANLCASARTIADTLRLGSGDRCLSVMPLFHIHGLVAAVLSTLTAGGSVVCPPGFDPARFFSWLAESAPSWYTAAPALHQAIVAEAPQHPDAVRACSLRVVRSCSAPLPRAVLDALEATFRAPVIEAYGMSEAAHQVSSNPLPPRARKHGSVGPATGCEVAVIDEGGRRVPPGTVGEVVIRGPNVTAGYEDDPAANTGAFRDGWLRTGDQGMLDEDGYLFLKGRLKDVINRGGEKVSPFEVEEALAEHPAIARAVAFPLPHVVLGEDVAAAVVLRPDGRVGEGDLRRFVAARLADFKVPSRVVVVDDIPTGATGKVRREALAAWLDARTSAPFAAPGDQLEQTVAGIWARVLGADAVGIHQNFFQLGGYSLAAARMLDEVERISGKRLPMSILFEAPTVAQLAKVLREEAPSVRWPSLVAVQPRGGRPPFFCVHGGSGNVLEFDFLARRLGPEQPFYGLQARGLDGVTPPRARIEDMAADYVEEIQAVQGDGPYLLGGLAIGGLVAFEMARQLESHGRHVVFLALFDTYFWNTEPRRAGKPLLRRIAEYHVDHLVRLGPCDMGRLTYGRRMLSSLGEVAAATAARIGAVVAPTVSRSLNPPVPPSRVAEAPPSTLQESLVRASRAYAPQPYGGRMTLFLARQRETFEGSTGWILDRLRFDHRIPEGLATGGIEIHKVPGNHFTMLHSAPHVAEAARILRACLDAAGSSLRAKARA
jgi:acyl-CoA synthetase (AMP-forming)/AMP-acid ligase II/thioesterase domain-containing protein